MKLTAGKRAVMFFHWLLSLLITVAFALCLLKPELATEFYGKAKDLIGDTQMMIIAIALTAVYVILTIAQAFIIFRRRRRTDRGFITMDSSDTGKVRIAISAIEQMVRQSVNNIDGIADMKIGIENMDDAIAINLNAAIESGRHVPTITMNMQRSIRQFVEMNCGVAVRAVSINISGVASADDQRQKRGRRHRGAEPVQQTTAYAPPVPAEPEITYPAYEPQQEEAPIQQPESQPELIEHTEVGLESDPEIDIEPITLKLERTGQPDYTITESGDFAVGAPAEAEHDIEMPEIGAEE